MLFDPGREVNSKAGTLIFFLKLKLPAEMAIDHALSQRPNSFVRLGFVLRFDCD